MCLFLVAGLSGCETIKGAGKDIEKAGEAIQRAAR
jgi:predicted small secreted protein